MAVLLLATLAIMAALAIAWEFWLEDPVSEALGLPYDGDFESAQRWRFIVTSVGFATLALIGPAVLLVRAFRTVDQARKALVVSREEAEALARHDPLTGMPNRRLFAEHLRTAFESSLGRNAGFAVLLIDLDWFKSVNDVHGHLKGDATLIEVARILHEKLPKDALAARLGGDEFGVLLSGHAEGEHPGPVAQRLIAAISEPRTIEGTRITIGATIGIAVAPHDGTESAGLLRAADAALYRAKEARGSLQFFEPGMGEDVRRDAEMREDLRNAILHGEVVPHYQPLIRFSQDRISGFEVLARWIHAEHGPVSPAQFIPVAEEAGLIGDLTNSILRQACRDAKAWPNELTLSVNISPRQLKDESLPGQILAILDETGFPASRLEIEITENALVENIELAKNILSELTAKGISVALDDFGTGYSSLYHLRELPFTKLKIDRSFVNAVHRDEDNRRLLEGILGLSRSLQIETTAEGIENPADAKWLAAHGCDYGQGFLYAKALPAQDVVKCLESFAGRPKLTAVA